jgi:hypothetical protein
MPTIRVLTPSAPPGTAAAQQRLPLEFAMPAPPAVPAFRLLAADRFDPVPTPARELPPLPAWAARLSIAIAETLIGRRPAGQLVRWVSHPVMTDLQELLRHRSAGPALVGRERRSPLVLRSLRWAEPADGVAEVAAVVLGSERPMVLALRLEGLDGRWCCVAAGSPEGWALGGREDLDHDEAA